MTTIQEVIDQNNRATDYVVGSNGPLDHGTAEFILRNTVVAADRLTAKEFSELGMPAVNAMLDAAAIAKEIAPLSEIEKQKMPQETRGEYEYRTQVWGQLHKLQAEVSLGDFDKSDPEIASVIKKAVWLGSQAFEAVVTDPVAESLPELQEAVRYFSGNANAAAGRAERART